jgi:protein-S-isoprenylcysteine O-methyltransferase Ste14
MVQPQTSEMKQKIVKRIVQVLSTTLFQGLVLFLAAGNLEWTWGWVFIGTYLVALLINALMLFRANPAVIAERADRQGARDWDQLWGGLAFGMIMIGLPLTGGLDFRFGWSTGMSQGLHLVGVAIFLVGGVFFAWAMAVNAKFATVVRIGDEDSHPVAMDGPYRIVRHPGYLGACFQSLGLPLLFGSWWAYIAAGLGIVFVIIRTVLEDKTLQAELPGYDKLVQQTRYRLFPGIW